MSRAYAYSDVGEYGRHEDINYLLRQYAEAVCQVATEAKVPLVDLFDLFTSRPDGLDLIPDGNHPWPEGHALIADALFEPVRRALGGEG
jgi:lysophospholipase L1-like esterase